MNVSISYSLKVFFAVNPRLPARSSESSTRLILGNSRFKVRETFQDAYIVKVTDLCVGRGRERRPYIEEDALARLTTHLCANSLGDVAEGFGARSRDVLNRELGRVSNRLQTQGHLA